MKKSNLSRNLRKLRTFKNMNQTEFAELFELNRPALASYEEGRSEPRLQTLHKIAKYFKLSMDDLFSRDLTVNQIAGFESTENKKSKGLNTDEKLELMEKRLASIEAALRLIVKNKTQM